MPETRARDLANLAGAGATSSTVAYHETARSFTLPAGAGEANQVISSDGDGTTQWKTTLSAPEITSATSDKGVNAYDSDGDDGAVIVVNGSSLGNDSSVLTVEISTDNFVTTVQTSTISILVTGTQIQATFNGTETNYNTINAGETVKVKVTKSNLQSAQSATLSGTVTGDPTFSTTSTTASTHTGTLQAESLGSYGGQVAGGGDDSNTKLLLNFDRGGGTDIEDSSNIGGNGHKVTVDANAVIKASPFGDGKSAMFFDGTNDKLVVDSSEDFNMGTSAFTIEWWMNYQDQSNDMIIFSQWVDASNRMYIQVKAGLDIKVFNRVSGTTTCEQHFETNFSLNEWNHFALVRDTTLKLYLNGVEQSSTNSTALGTGNFGRTNTLDIGYYDGEDDNFAECYLDEIRIVKGVAVYTGNFTVPTSRLSATQSAGTNISAINDWNSSTNVGTALLIHSDQTYDSSDYNHVVTAKGDAHMTTTNGRANWNNSSWSLDGTDDYLVIPKSSNFNFGTDDFCIEFWWRGDFGANDVFWSFGASGATGNWMMYQEASNKVRVTMGSDGTRQFDTDSSTVWQGDSSWHHFAMTKTGTTLKLYIDGIEETTVNASFNSTPSSSIDLSSFDLAIGTDTNGDYDLAGNIVDFRIVKGTTVYTGGNFDNALPTGSLTKTGGTYAGTTNRTDPTATQTLLLINGDGAKFEDSATSGTTHNITATGAYHSQGHGGIAPAMTWPTSEKLTGSAGIYLDGTSDRLIIPHSTDFGYHASFTWDFFVYFSVIESNRWIDKFSSDLGYFIGYNHSNGGIEYGWYPASAGGTASNTTVTKSWSPSTNTWYHICVARSGYTGNVYMYVDGTSIGNGNANDGSTTQSGENTGTGDLSIGSYGANAAEFHGYMDHIRYSSADETASGGSLYHSSADTITVPTKIYGAYRSQDVGTIQLNATAGTGGGALDYAELSGGTALSTYGLSLSSSGAITGTLSGLADNSNSGGVIRIRARANADDNRVTTLGGSSFAGITQNDGKAPVLFNARRWWGTGVARSITGIGFKPDFVWIKERDADASNHQLQDSIRGTGSVIYSNTNDDADTVTDRLTSFDSDGFSISTNSAINGNNDTFIGWAFKAGGAPTTDQASQVRTPTSGALIKDGSFVTTTDYWSSSDIYPTRQSVNTAGDFSITKYSGTASAINQTKTIPHGLSGAPDLVICKRLDSSSNWPVFHTNLSSTKNVVLDDAWEETATLSNGYIASVSSNQVTLNAGSNSTNYGINCNRSGATFIMYAWKAVSNVSAFGTYVGRTGGWASDPGGNNGGAIDVGFKPRFLIIKNISGSGSWSMWDTFRTPAGDDMVYLYPNGNSVEQAGSSSFTPTLYNDGFRFDGNVSHASLNGSGNSYIYMAFA